MTAAAHQQQHQDDDPWADERRATQLARLHDLVGQARCLGNESEQCEVYVVPSRSQPDTPHRVRVYGECVVACDCKAAAHGKPCGHAGAVMLALRARYVAWWRDYFDVLDSEHWV